MESDLERQAFATAWGDTGTVNGKQLAGQFDAEGVDLEGVSTRSPTFRTSAAELERVGLTVPGTITNLRTFTGRDEGAFRVVRAVPEDDGAFVLLQLARDGL